MTSKETELTSFTMFNKFTGTCIGVLAVVLSSTLDQASGGEKQVPRDQKNTPQQEFNADELLAGFSKAWDDSKWENKFRGGSGYMRTTGDEGWKTRMKIMQSLVAGGEESISVLEKSLTSDHTPTRILAAQTIGYLATQANTEKLIEVIKNDTDPAVRLYAVDALGMSGKGPSIDWDSFTKGEKNGDVLKHLKYAKERQNTAVSEAVLKTLIRWDASTMDSAKVGQKAPDFNLTTVDGEEITLSEFQGKHPVVLVFIYGDT